MVRKFIVNGPMKCKLFLNIRKKIISGLRRLLEGKEVLRFRWINFGIVRGMI